MQKNTYTYKHMYAYVHIYAIHARTHAHTTHKHIYTQTGRHTQRLTDTYATCTYTQYMNTYVCTCT